MKNYLPPECLRARSSIRCCTGVTPTSLYRTCSWVLGRRTP